MLTEAFDNYVLNFEIELLNELRKTFYTRWNDRNV